MISRSAAGNGNGRIKTQFTTLKMAVLAPIPSARERIATAVNPGLLFSSRNANRMSLVAALQEAFLTRTYEEWEAMLLPAGIPMGAINTIDQVVDHAQVRARGSLVESTHPVAGSIRMTGPPVRMSDTPGTVRTPAPLLGEHTEEILRDRLGTTAEEIARLKNAGIIRTR